MSVYGNMVTENTNESLDINLETVCLEFSNYCSFIDEFVLESNIEILNEGFKEIFAKIKEKAIKIFKNLIKKINNYRKKNKNKQSNHSDQYNKMMQRIQNRYSDIYFDFLNGK